MFGLTLSFNVYSDYTVYAGVKLSLPTKQINGGLLIGTNNGWLRFMNSEDMSIIWENNIGSGIVKDIYASGEKIYVLVDNVLRVYDKNGNYIEEKTFSNISSAQAIVMGSDGNLYTSGYYIQSINYETGAQNYIYSSSSTLGDISLSENKVYSVDGKYRLRIMDFQGNLLEEKTYGTNQNPYGVGVNESGIYGVNVSGSTKIYNADGSYRCGGGLSGGTKATGIELDENYAYGLKQNTGHSNHGLYKLRLSDCALVWDYNKSEGAGSGTGVAVDGYGNGYLATGSKMFKVSGVDAEEWIYEDSSSISALHYLK